MAVPGRVDTLAQPLSAAANVQVNRKRENRRRIALLFPSNSTHSAVI
jgi:hypothetical protein